MNLSSYLNILIIFNIIRPVDSERKFTNHNLNDQKSHNEMETK